MNEEIMLINKITEQAILHGGDYGGAYCCNEDGLRNALTEYIKFKGLENKYTVSTDEDKFLLIVPIRKINNYDL
jgi:hypothetical protein